MYTAFAHVYDALMAQVDYDAWAEHYSRLMAECGVPARGKCVECACGTGNLTLPLRRVGYQMTGVDLSEEMIAAAMEKARKAGLDIPFVRQDMTALKVPGRVHAVLATCDGVNYLTSPEKARACFAAATPGSFSVDPQRLSLSMNASATPASAAKPKLNSARYSQQCPTFCAVCS